MQLSFPSIFVNYYHRQAHFPGLPKKIPLHISKTQFLCIDSVPDEIPDEIYRGELIQYILYTISLIVDHNWEYRFTRDDLLLKHFFNHDILLKVDSKDEHYFVEKTIENHTQPYTLINRKSTGSIGPTNTIMRDVGLADLKLASEIMSKYKQEDKFGYFFSQVD